jgi:hypothetical protein
MPLRGNFFLNFLHRIQNHNKLVHSLLRLFFRFFNDFFQIFQTNTQLIFKGIVKFSIDNGGIRKANRVGTTKILLKWNTYKLQATIMLHSRSLLEQWL